MKFTTKDSVLSALALLFLLFLFSGSSGGQSGPCSNKTIKGEYGFSFTGQILGGPLAGPIVGVGTFSFDGHGNLTQLDHTLSNGTQPKDQWRFATGTYTVNSDCTGTLEIDFTDGSPPITGSIVVVDRGREILDVINNAGTSITGTSIKRD